MWPVGGQGQAVYNYNILNSGNKYNLQLLSNAVTSALQQQLHRKQLMRFKPCLPICYSAAIASLIYIAPNTKLPSASQTLRLRWVNFNFCSNIPAHNKANQASTRGVISGLGSDGGPWRDDSGK